MKSKNKNILIFIDWFIPAYKAGGPISSVLNLVNHLSGKFNFFIVTGDRDLGDSKSYENVEFNVWVQVNNYKVIYLTKPNQNKKKYISIYNNINPDYVYLNSLYSYRFSILPLLSFKSNNGSIFLSPRGMFGPRSLKVKVFKKKVFLYFSKVIGLYKNVRWIASSEIEQKEIFLNMGNGVEINVIPNLPIKQNKNNKPSALKEKGEILLICICRISPIKNINFLFDVLENVPSKVSLSIVGPIEDKGYWNKCLLKLNKLPPNIRVKYIGEKSPSSISNLLLEHHCLVSTSLNENYGHSIVEALSLSCPVVVSNHTPWRDLENHLAGVNLDLKTNLYAEKINFFAEMGQDEFVRYRNGALDYFNKKIDLDIFKDSYIKLFC